MKAIIIEFPKSLKNAGYTDTQITYLSKVLCDNFGEEVTNISIDPLEVTIFDSKTQKRFIYINPCHLDLVKTYDDNGKEIYVTQEKFDLFGGENN